MRNKQLSDFELVEQLKFARIYSSLERSIILVEYFENTVVNLEKGKEVANAVYPYIVKGMLFGFTDATAKNIHVTTEARKFLGNNKSMNALNSHVIVLNDLHLRIIANIFLKFDNPTALTKVFNTHQKALKYLELQMSELTVTSD